MKRLISGLSTLALLSSISSLPPVQTQTAEAATRHEGPFSYDISKEKMLDDTAPIVVTDPNEHGFALSPQALDLLTHASQREGEQL
jgi:hypothetical protein